MIASPAILTDTTLCTGCETCVAACKSVNGLSEDRPRRWKRRIDDLSSTRFTTLVRETDAKGLHFVRKQCRHCLEPACASACIVGALQKTPEGPVIYDDTKCIGCRYCMVACPYGIPRYDWQNAVPYVRKCTLCYKKRLLEGGQPGCTEVCPTKATIFGSRDELLGVARKRLAESPGRYVRKIYGEHEVGGTAVLMISGIPLDFLSWKPEMGDQPLPELTWAALSKVPPIILTVGGLMAGIYWIIGRRMQMEALRASSGSPSAAAQTPGTEPDVTSQEENAK